ncbi:MAG: hypothetical protein L7F77_16525 [Candidatus Magnetominusculus sp. LBB02]|nr:hypothetical protein [Candidatus Magnetominusculus sp. LBB02]
MDERENNELKIRIDELGVQRRNLKWFKLPLLLSAVMSFSAVLFAGYQFFETREHDT